MSGLLRRFYGWGLRKNHENYCLRASLKEHLMQEYRRGNIKTIYDIGANQGTWAHEIKNMMPKSEIYLFEANPAMKPHLEKTGYWYQICALSDKSEEKIFFSRDGTGDSFYKEKTWSGQYEEKKLRTLRLDDIVKEHQIPLPDFVKIDTQGSELDILKGGSSVLANTKLLLSETPFTEYNLGAPNIGDYLETYRNLGFTPTAICEIHRKNGNIVQIDILFSRVSD
ncbi:hypothetical protein DLREEDagrD3_12220 [Denitratisoma sp. agr-D3]